MWLKTVHVTCAVASFSGFFLRGLWMMQDSSWLKQRWMKIAPHIVDTTLLGSAILLAIRIRQYPFVDGWLTAKLIGLLAYIGLGLVALRLGRTRGMRIGAWVAALTVFLYIVSVALTRSPTLGLA